MSEFTARRTVVQSGTFISVPSAFPDADAGVRDAIKLEFRPFTDGTARDDDPLGIRTSFATDRFLVDIAAIDAAALDGETLATDCEIVTRIAREHPDQLRELLLAQQRPGGFTEAAAIAEKIGLTEAAARRSGGGLLWLLVVAVALVAGSCEHCHASHSPHDQ